MTQAELNQLEREVEEVRHRFARDLERLRSPATLSGFKDDLLTEARESRDELVAKTKETASETASRLWDDIKEKAAANPVAVLAIGAGLAWRMVQRPPIASILVGTGVASLLRTDVQHPSRGAKIVERVGELADTAKQRAEQWRSENQGMISRAGEVADAAKQRAEQWRSESQEMISRAGELASSAGETIQDWSAQAGESASRFADTAKSAVGHGSETVSYILRHEEERDKYLLGAAAIAVAAALGIACQRRLS